MKQRVMHLTAKDFIVDTFRSGGKGGQHQNTADSGVRIKHPPSGAVGESREHRSQHVNKKTAFKRMTNSDVFQKWLKLEHNRKCGLLPTPEQIEKEVDEIISRDMENGNIRIETFSPKK